MSGRATRFQTIRQQTRRTVMQMAYPPQAAEEALDLPIFVRMLNAYRDFAFAQ